MYTTIKLKEFINTNTWGSGYLMTSLRASILKVSVTDRGGYWATSSGHFLHTAPWTPFSICTRLRCYPFWTMPAYYGTSITRRTNYFLRISNCLPLELQQNPDLRNRLLSSPASTSPITDEPPLISETYFAFINLNNLGFVLLFFLLITPNLF